MNKKPLKILISLVLVLGLSGSLLFPVLAAEPKTQEEDKTEEVTREELHITSPERFLDFAENCRLDAFSENLTVYLDTDLDLTGREFSGIPIFQGILEGQNHTISGLSITADGSNLGLIRYLTQAGSVRNLTVQGEIHPEGSQTNVGGIAGCSAGTVENCRFDGQISGGDAVGGIVGSNQMTGIITGCQSEGNASGNHFIGGIAGENKGVIRSCVNRAAVNTSVRENTVNVTSITMDTITGTEAANTVTDVGGITGTSTGVIRDCTNRGDVGYRHMGYNIGGIAGSQSGLITGCQNYGTVFGRKEAGGIVGQFEPVSEIEYQIDTLQILEGQLASASAALNRAAYNAQGNMGSVGQGIGDMMDYSEAAREALRHMLPTDGIDLDTQIAAKNALQENLRSMRSTMSGMAESIGATAGQLNQDLKAVSGQMSAMSQTIRDASEHLGGTLTDISDADTEDDLTAKVSHCKNLAAVSGDLNAGGIAGSIALENDLDPEDDLQVLGERSLNFDGHLRAVLLDCENQGTVSAKKSYAGGIVGWMTLGLARNCRNTGTVDAEKAQYVGGIAGYSRGYIRSCDVKCGLIGDTCVGGIAGSGTVVSDCLSMVTIRKGSEKLGAVLGILEPSQDESISDPISNNLYMSLSRDLGAIDGISYRGQAEPLPPHKFQHLEGLPEAFQKTTLTFRGEDGSQSQLIFPMGSILKAESIPPVPPKEGYTGVWEDLELYQGQRIYFDSVFLPLYTPNRITIRSPQTRRTGRPVLLAEGVFTDVEQIDLEVLPIPQVDDQQILEAWRIPSLSDIQATPLHLAQPDGTEAEALRILVHRKDGSWEEIPSTVNARHIVFSLQPGETEFCVAQVPDYGWVLYAAGGAAAILAVIALAVILKLRKKKTKHPPQEASQ